MEKSMQENFKLDCIRRNTLNDLSDAAALAARILGSPQKPNLSKATAHFSNGLFIAVALELAYTKEDATFADMLKFIVSPDWDSGAQMLQLFQHADEAFEQAEASVWRKEFVEMVRPISHDAAETLVRESFVHWKSAGRTSRTTTRRKPRPRGCVRVFDQEAVADALNMTARLSTEKRSGATLILENAQVNEGYRAVVNPGKGIANLEKAKGEFENLAEPINRLQSRLVLAGAMKPSDFHIPPILLLGEPGIGKTSLAMQLAKSLAVPMEKISAGSAQGAFQFTGSHTSWTSARPGSLITLLAKGKSASPVVIVDEVDKIRDAQYPVLPVLLDLLERETAKQFRDEFFEMAFDASKIFFVLTANSLEGVPSSLTSRCEIFDVPRPLPKQRLRIIERIANALRVKTGRAIRMDRETSVALSEGMDIDLREVTRLVEDAFAKAIQAGESVAFLCRSKLNSPYWGNASNRQEAREILH